MPSLRTVLRISGSVVTDSTGTAIITFPARPYKPHVFLSPESLDSDVVAVITGWRTEAGNYTGVYIRTYRVVPDVSKATTTVLSDVTATTDTFVVSIPSATGDASGRYTVDAYGVVHHDHPIPPPATGTAVTGVSKTTATVLSDVTLGAQPAPNTRVSYLIVLE